MEQKSPKSSAPNNNPLPPPHDINSLYNPWTTNLDILSRPRSLPTSPEVVCGPSVIAAVESSSSESGFQTQSLLHTNEKCWVIHDHRNSKKYGRADTEFLSRRWKPDGCELPVFNPAQFLELVRDKLMAFVVDSFARNQSSP